MTDMEEQVRVKYHVSGPSKTPSENTHISDKTIYLHKCSWLTSFYCGNILRIVNMVFESNILTNRVRANTLFSRRIQPSTHSSPIPAIWPSVEVLNNGVWLNPDCDDLTILQATTVHVRIKS